MNRPIARSFYWSLVVLCFAMNATFSPAQVDLLATSANPSSTSVLRYDGMTGAPRGPFTSGGSLQGYDAMAYGPNGNLFVAGFSGGGIQQFNGLTGAFINIFVPNAGFNGAFGDGNFVFGPDNNLYAPAAGGAIWRYSGSTGQFLNVFASSGSAGLVMRFGLDGNLYADEFNGAVRRYDGITGQDLGLFIQPGSGGLQSAGDLLWRTNGNLLVSDFTGNRILEYDGTTGVFVRIFSSGGMLDRPFGMTLGPDGNLYVVSEPSRVLRYNGSSGSFMDVFATGAHPFPDYVLFTPAPVPEPPSVVMTSVGLCALALCWSRRRRLAGPSTASLSPAAP